MVVMTIIFVLIAIIFVLQIVMFRKQQKDILSLSGLPLSLPLLGSEINFIHEKNYIICVSIHCIQCKKIINELLTSNLKRDDIYLVFTNNKEDVEEYLDRHVEINKSINCLSGYTNEDLFLAITPFAYLIDNNGRVINKKSLKSLKEINIDVNGV